MQVIDTLQRIHVGNFPQGNQPFFEGVRQFLEEYGYCRATDIPSGFSRMAAMVDGRHTGTFLFNQVGSDLGSLLQELHDTYGWIIDDYGEGIDMTFPKTKVRVFISREALDAEGQGCSSCSISRIA